MDRLTDNAVKNGQPALAHIAELLSASLALMPVTTPGREKVEAAFAQVEQLIEQAKDLAVKPVLAEQAADVLANVAAAEALRGDDLAREVAISKHLAAKTRAQAQRATEALKKATELYVSAGLPALAGELAPVERGLAEIDRLWRQGYCGCPVAVCEFAKRENQPSKSPLRRHVGPLVKGKPQLAVVRGEDEGPKGGAA